MGNIPEPMRVWLLGGFRVSVGLRTIDEDAWRLRKAASLLKLLASGHRLHREQAMEALWPKLGLQAASNNLRQTLHVARRTLHPDPEIASDYLSLSGGQLVMCPEGGLQVDMEALEEAADTARRSGDPTVHRAAIELYAGELLPEDRYEGWAEESRLPKTPTGVASHNLPAQRSSFVGREREMLEAKRALAMARLLTLTGAGDLARRASPQRRAATSSVLIRTGCGWWSWRDCPREYWCLRAWPKQ